MSDSINVENLRTVSGDFPAWLKRAISRASPRTKDNETVRTMSFEINGKEIIVPTIRLVEGKLKKYKPQDALEEALRRRDYIVTDNPSKATDISKAISSYIDSKRRSILNR